MHKLDNNEIKAKLSKLDSWKQVEQKISKTYKFKDFLQSLNFVNKIAAICEKQNHHPDIEFGWGYAKITFTTHDAAGLTELDFETAALIDRP